MLPLRHNLPAEYRARAKATREKAARLTDEAAKAALLNDAALWERMAEHEETANSQPPQPDDPEKDKG